MTISNSRFNKVMKILCIIWVVVVWTYLIFGCSAAVQIREYPVTVHAEEGSCVEINITVVADVDKEDEIKQETKADVKTGGL
jgi:hypothetical protein